MVNFQEVYDELDHLRKLVQKYRLELSNREGNFNRMFTGKMEILGQIEYQGNS